MSRQNKADIRERVATFLALLTSEECFRALSSFVPPERLGIELIRVWMDEIYTPGLRYFDGLKGDRDREAADDFMRAFDENEWAFLERFHRFLELRVEMLNDAERAAGFPRSERWDALRRDAGYALEAMDPQADDRRRRLRARLNSLAERPGANGKDLEQVAGLLERIREDVGG